MFIHIYFFTQFLSLSIPPWLPIFIMIFPQFHTSYLHYLKTYQMWHLFHDILNPHILISHWVHQWRKEDGIFITHLLSLWCFMIVDFNQMANFSSFFVFCWMIVILNCFLLNMCSFMVSFRHLKSHLIHPCYFCVLLCVFFSLLDLYCWAKADPLSISESFFIFLFHTFPQYLSSQRI